MLVSVTCIDTCTKEQYEKFLLDKASITSIKDVQIKDDKYIVTTESVQNIDKARYLILKSFAMLHKKTVKVKVLKDAKKNNK